MKRLPFTLIVFSLLAIGVPTASHADGLIKKLPLSGHWSSYYLHLPLDCSVDSGREKIDLGDSTLDCIGLESADTIHKTGSDKHTVSSTAYRQWACDETNFGVVKYDFERLGLDGTSFSQKLTLKESGENTESSLPEIE
jgi:hypothetical protein